MNRLPEVVKRPARARGQKAMSQRNRNKKEFRSVGPDDKKTRMLMKFAYRSPRRNNRSRLNSLEKRKIIEMPSIERTPILNRKICSISKPKDLPTNQECARNTVLETKTDESGKTEMKQQIRKLIQQKKAKFDNIFQKVIMAVITENGRSSLTVARLPWAICLELISFSLISYRSSATFLLKILLKEQRQQPINLCELPAQISSDEKERVKSPKIILKVNCDISSRNIFFK
ncbi:unnamed protein product [Moneuplotes crassus]|uniref:Uncharacterized protein n=1 Tax=Euplotes crassus TaxID=5936 RepID=A0AAD1XB93_EUPCR|nr:unnamed protein product [Moneuplotes crassus]